MPSTGGSRAGSGGDDTGHGSSGGMGGGFGGGESMGIDMFGPMGLKGYKQSAGKFSFSHPSSWSQQQRDKAKSDYTKSRSPQGAFDKFSATVFGYNAMPPYLDPKTVKPMDAVSQYMDFLTAKRGILGRVSPTVEGVATDLGLSALGALGGPLAPGPVIGGFAGAVNVVSNYKDDKAAAMTKLSEAGYSMKDVEASFKDYEAGLVSGLEGFGGGMGGEGGREHSEYDKALAEGLKAEQEGGDMKTSTSQASNVEEMRTARKKKTQRVFAGQLGSSDSGNQVKKAKLLGQ